MTDKVTLGELVQKGESQTLEFKKSLSLQGEGLEALCAMVNSDLSRGTVVLELKQMELSAVLILATSIQPNVHYHKL